MCAKELCYVVDLGNEGCSIRVECRDRLLEAQGVSVRLLGCLEEGAEDAPDPDRS